MALFDFKYTMPIQNLPYSKCGDCQVCLCYACTISGRHLTKKSFCRWKAAVKLVFCSYAICGALRRMGEADDCLNRLAMNCQRTSAHKREDYDSSYRCFCSFNLNHVRTSNRRKCLPVLLCLLRSCLFPICIHSLYRDANFF